jgi:F-box and WD-40 domain protein CDC4
MLRAAPSRPLSAAEYRSAIQELPMQDAATQNAQSDVEMTDAGPSTAPPLATGPTFFHEDD